MCDRFVTLYHWELPQELEDAGGWPRETRPRASPTSPAQVVAALGDLADDWITLNEPWCQAFLGYESGIHAPGPTGPPRRRGGGPPSQPRARPGRRGPSVPSRPQRTLGIANIVTDVVPASQRAEDLAATERYDTNSNRLFLDPVLLGRYPAAVHELYREQGFDALLHPDDEATYREPRSTSSRSTTTSASASRPTRPTRISGRTARPPNQPPRALGWSVIPGALRDVLLRVHPDYPPIPLYVTENGASYHD